MADSQKNDIRFLYLKINVYICREIYRKMWSTKNVIFIEKRSDKNNRHTYLKWGRIFGDVNITERRINNILAKNTNSSIHKPEAIKIAEIFNISKYYFLKDETALLEINGIDIEDWKKVFYLKYGMDYDVHPKNFDQSKLMKKIDKKIKEIIRSCEKDDLEHINPLYRIWYYYKNGASFKDDEIVEIIKKKIADLDNIKPAEWELIKEDKDIQYAIRVFGDKLDMLQALATYRKKFKNNNG